MLPRLLVLALLLVGCGDDGNGYDPCAGLDCGDECQLCEPGDPDCVETSIVKLCGSGGVCSSSPVTCEQ